MVGSLFAIIIFGVFTTTFLSALWVVSDSSQLTSLAAASMMNAADGAAKIAACPYNEIVVTNWRAEYYELRIPIHKEHFASTNYYSITETNMTKLVQIENIFSHRNRLITNKIYHLSYQNP